MAQFLLSVSLLWTWLKPVSWLMVSSATPSPEAVVRAVLFYSPTCGHCQTVINEVLPPLLEQYRDQLVIIGVDVTQPGGQTLFQAARQHFNMERSGVPMLVVGKSYLVGSLDIPDKFPALIESYLNQGGIDWPDIPGLAEALAAAEPAPSPTATSLLVVATPTLASTTVAASPTPVVPTPTHTVGLLLTGGNNSGLGVNFAHDPLGNLLAVVVLMGMLVSVGWGALFFRRTHGKPLALPRGWTIPILCVIGFGVAGYLAYVETSRITAVCGPVGDCNSVQQSEYARLFGVLPVGVLGLVGYGMILLAWAVACFSVGKLADYASLGLLGMTLIGTLFSIYLTFLEPFVIGATCAWCLTSAILMMVLFCLSLAPGKTALFHILQNKSGL